MAAKMSVLGLIRSTSPISQVCTMSALGGTDTMNEGSVHDKFSNIFKYLNTNIFICKTWILGPQIYLEIYVLYFLCVHISSTVIQDLRKRE